MPAVGVHDQIKKAFQDVVAPEIHELRGEIRRLDQKVDGMDAKLTAMLTSMRGELLAEIRRLDARVDGVDRELRTAIDIRERLAALEARRPA